MDNKSLIRMQSFNKFISEISDYYKNQTPKGSLLQITVKNHDQLSMLCNKKELDDISVHIFSAIEAISSGGINFKIFEFNKFFYLIIDEEDEVKIQSFSIDIHHKLMSDTKLPFFLEIRVVGTKIREDCSLYNTSMILAENIHYIDPNKIFYYIPNPTEYLKKIHKDYESLNELRDSLSSKSACFAFQPVVKCDTGEVAYHECLLRLNNDDFKLVSAGPYIMLAEKYGYITVVDKYVFAMAFDELNAAKDLSLSINISNIGVQDKTLIDFIDTNISKFGFGKRMTIEITETAMNHNFKETKYFVDMIKSHGCKLALDDFGVGYTSFQQLQQFDVDIIKIDGSYIRDVDINETNRVLVHSLIRTAEELGCKTVAEFVESGSIAKKLIELKVDYMQGNFFSPAVNYRSWEKE